MVSGFGGLQICMNDNGTAFDGKQNPNIRPIYVHQFIPYNIWHTFTYNETVVIFKMHAIPQGDIAFDGIDFFDKLLPKLFMLDDRANMILRKEINDNNSECCGA